MTTRFLVGAAIVVCVLMAAPVDAQLPSTGQAPAKNRPDATSPANAGRRSLNNYLDSVAAEYTAQRRATVAAIRTRAEAEARQAKVRDGLQKLIGRLPERTPLNAKVIGSTQAEGFRIEKILFDSQPGFHVTALLYLPDGKSTGQKLPAILLSPGHSAAGKASDYFSAALFARNGFVVLSYDPIGQGERLQYPDPQKPDTSLATRPTGEHGEAGLQPSLIGDTVALYMLWDSMRGVDYLSERSEVDAKHIGAFGCSGGGAMTALAGALDSRLAAIGVACYTTSFDTLLPSLGPQDGEQSLPHFIASGFDFPDWIEAAAPRPYAVVATYSDMFPFQGARSTVIEARRFYALFDPASAGVSKADTPASVPPVPTGPALNPDTTNEIPPAAVLQFITGPGGHGALLPIYADILRFFARNLMPGSAFEPIVPPPMPRGSRPELPTQALLVTPTGKVATSYPNSETVFSLNQKRAAELIRTRRNPVSAKELAEAIRMTLGTTKTLAAQKPDAQELAIKSGEVAIHSEPGIDLHGYISGSTGQGRQPAVILLVPDSINGEDPIARANKAEFDRLVAAGNIVLAITPRPSPPGSEDKKSPILGSFYLLSLRAQLVSQTILGMRVDDVSRITDYLVARPDVDASRITAIGSGHMGLVLLHAAVLDPRLKQVTVDHVLTSYESLVNTPMPVGAAEDIVPGVLLRYDIPDIVKALGTRVIISDPS